MVGRYRTLNFMIISSFPEFCNEFLGSYSVNQRVYEFFNPSVCLEFFRTVLLKPYLRKKQLSSFRKYELSIFISHLPNSLVDSFPYVMFIITNLIELPMAKLILNHFIGNNCPEFRNELPDSYFCKLTLEFV